MEEKYDKQIQSIQKQIDVLRYKLARTKLAQLNEVILSKIEEKTESSIKDT